MPASQRRPHAPQFAGSVSESVQKAVSPAPHASGRDGGQAQAPEMQRVPAGHVLPQVPQSVTDEDRSVQYIAEPVAGQAAWPSTHETTQAPSEHRVPDGHEVPHVPQFAGSVSRSVQNAEAPEPHASGRESGQAHAPSSQRCPAGHAKPQAPQWFGSVARSAQNEGTPSTSHAVNPPEQPCTQRPSSQSRPSAQVFPQAPQLSRSSRRSVQRASAPSPHASGRPAGQAHDPIRSSSDATHAWPPGQAFPQAPQCKTSEARLAQVPSQKALVSPEHGPTHRPSSQAKPAGHATPHAAQFIGSAWRSAQ